MIQVQLATHEPLAEWIFWRSGRQPGWVDRWGFDEYGAWATFSLTQTSGEQITQRMRWIGTGKYHMGSPLGEEGRFDSEGPQHIVTLTQGYWLFDTQVTQALWQAVMGANPSRFKSPDRPVESVSWEDCEVFLDKLNLRFPGLDLELPSESQWEYACRA
ncbi:MAG: SUMF1/EgtB/PvdO family nonheme iron enzyme, partial [Gammaproteobacteria bacterium]|nr:SUMF1/EgtB/PvdO family nonheme iron enzyme [Gammaproteobacteria bacterium]